MKTSKGFATILAIIIGLLVVGGGIYALETLNTDEDVEEVSDVTQNTENKDNTDNDEANSSGIFTVNISDGGILKEPVHTGNAVNLNWEGCNDDISIVLHTYVENSPHETVNYPVVNNLNGVSYNYIIPDNIPSGEYNFWVYSEKCRIGAYSDEFFTVTNISDEYPEGKPIIESISPASGPIGTEVTITGDELAGFEGDLIVIFEREDGEKIIRWDEGSNYIKFQGDKIEVTVEEPCQEGEKDPNYGAYSGLSRECQYVEFTPGTYKVYTEPWGKKSNEVTFILTE